ncbi:MAG: phosphoribosylamine--glycine ligase [Chitinophagales bacterium]
MKILLLGSGGREHTYAWKMAQSPLCSKLYIAPGNAGTKQHGENVDLNILDFKSIENFCLEKQIELVVVGPEQPLVEGIYDYFQKTPGISNIPIFGPSLKGAMLEGSKGYAKAFMFRHEIPTAHYKEFVHTQVQEGIAYIQSLQPPIVLKADGLAAGKGVVISQSIDEAVEEFTDMLDGKFGQAGSKVVIEEFMTGLEYSVFVLTDGKSYKILPVAKDYKRIGEGDTGLNTGGMGAISPPPFVTDELMKTTIDTVVEPTIQGLKEENIDYKGIVYIGLMNTPTGPRVIEYNCRMGDPETQAVFPRIKSDLVELILAASTEKLADVKIELDTRAAATVILASGGYPEAYEKGKIISGLEGIEESLVFHAGTQKDSTGNHFLTNGGRVLAVTSLHENWQQALTISNRNAESIKFEGKYFRKDIGFDLR